MIQFALKLVLAHLIGDFLFQPDKWVENKEKYTYKSRYLYYHILIHAISLTVLLQLNFSYWKGVFLILISHYVIDIIKAKLNEKVNIRILFFLDQISHFIIIVCVIRFYYPFDINSNLIFSPKVLLLIISLLSVTTVSSIIMKVIIKKWHLKEDANENSLEKAGKYIGILERLFVFVFILINQWQAIGFLLAAKSVFRFGDLSNAKDRKLTEYILIGTLFSFGLAILIGLLYSYILQKYIPNDQNYPF